MIHKEKCARSKSNPHHKKYKFIEDREAVALSTILYVYVFITTS